MRKILIVFLFSALPALAQYGSDKSNTIPAAGRPTITIIHTASNDKLASATSFSLTGIPSSTAGNSIIVCTAISATTVTGLTFTDNATGGSNTYTVRTAATSTTTANG